MTGPQALLVALGLFGWFALFACIFGAVVRDLED